MFPFNKDKTVWSEKNSNIAHRAITAQVKDDLIARDIRRGVPADHKTYTVTNPGDERGTFVIDPDLAAKKHSGLDSRLLRRARWAEFCSVPQNEVACVQKYEAELRAEVAATRIADGERVILDDSLEEDAPKRAVKTSSLPKPKPEEAAEPQPVEATELIGAK